MKHISVMGHEIPLVSEKLIKYLNYKTKASLSDTDILIIYPSVFEEPEKPEIEISWGDSFEKKKEIYSNLLIHWANEIFHFLNNGGTLVVVLTEENGSIEGSNYYPVSISYTEVNNAIGINMIVTDTIFKPLFDKLKQVISYEVFITSDYIKPSFMTPKKDRVLGGYYQMNKGCVILLPKVDFEPLSQFDSSTGNSVWSSNNKKLGQTFIEEIIRISKQLKSGSDKTPPPEWSKSENFNLKEVEQTKVKIYNNLNKISKLEKENESLKEKLEEQEILKGLLYENGTPLEKASIKAFEILECKAENYNDGKLELDLLISTPENKTFIGECEGKDNDSIKVSKFRQILDSMRAYIYPDNIDEEAEFKEAFGLLIGNPYRLTNPTERNSDSFTPHCIERAKKENIGLINTLDLFYVARYIQESNDKKFAKKCREAIFEQLGGTIKFPEIPSGKDINILNS